MKVSEAFIFRRLRGIIFVGMFVITREAEVHFKDCSVGDDNVDDDDVCYYMMSFKVSINKPFNKFS